MLKYFKKPSLLMLFISSLLTLTAVKSNAHIKCPVREPIFGTTNDRCPHPPHKNPLTGLSEEVWGEAGRVAYQTAAATMAKRSPTGEPLDASLKNALRPHFDGLVDRVTIHWGTPGLDKWSANQIGINLSGTESAGQTYGHDIYLDQQKPNDYSQGLIKLIIHEMVHSEQYERYGSELSNFGYHYFKKYKQAGQNYDNNELERKAAAKADRHYQQVYAAVRDSDKPTIGFPDLMIQTSGYPVVAVFSDRKESFALGCPEIRNMWSRIPVRTVSSQEYNSIQENNPVIADLPCDGSIVAVDPTNEPGALVIKYRNGVYHRHYIDSPDFTAALRTGDLIPMPVSVFRAKFPERGTDFKAFR